MSRDRHSEVPHEHAGRAPKVADGVSARRSDGTPRGATAVLRAPRERWRSNLTCLGDARASLSRQQGSEREL